MTTRKLTPAEALECVRAWADDAVSWEQWQLRYGHLLDDGEDAWELLRSSCDEIGEALDRLATLEALSQKPIAAPVPSDDWVIVQNLANAVDCLPRDGQPIDDGTIKIAIRNLHAAVKLLARRIGVQGVPK